MGKVKTMMVLIIEDHALTAKATRDLIKTLCPAANVLTAHTMEVAEQVLVAAGEPDHILLDLALPRYSGLSALDRILTLIEKNENTLVTVISGHDDPDVIRACWEAGAVGFVRKGDSEQEQTAALKLILCDGMVYFPINCFGRREHRTRPRFTPRQLAVLRVLLSTQGSNKEIATALGLDIATVKTHMQNLYQRTGTQNRSQLIHKAMTLGLDKEPAHARWTTTGHRTSSPETERI